MEAITPTLQRSGLTVSAGIGSGCEYFSGGYSNVIPDSLSPDELEQAAAIYAYDLLVQNPDRTRIRPNCAIHSGHFKVYDFETAFSFVLLIGTQDRPLGGIQTRLGENPPIPLHTAQEQRRCELEAFHIVAREDQRGNDWQNDARLTCGLVFPRNQDK